MANSSTSSSREAADKMPDATSPPPTPSSPSYFNCWKERILYPTLLGGFVGGAIGPLSKHRKVHGLAKVSAMYATNLAIVAGCYCGHRELIRVARKFEPDDLINSAVGGFCSGALLGRIHDGQRGAIRYSIMFAIAGTAYDYATLKLEPLAKRYYDSLINGDIQIVDEETFAAKKAREEQLHAQRTITLRSKES